MKTIILSLIFLFSTYAFAEHDAIYCGKILDGKLGKDDSFNDHPEIILEVKTRIENGYEKPWYEAYAAVVAMTDDQLKFALKAVNSSKDNGTLFCISARWGGAAYSSWDIEAISLLTDNVYRIDYRSSFL
jgi:hypothetical protein